MKMKYLVGIAVMMLVFTGCTSKQDTYYSAVKEQNQKYMEAYATVENESVEFDGTFNGKIKMVKPKKLPQLANIRQPKSGSEVALEWARVVVPFATVATGQYFGYKATDSSNKYNAQSLEAWTGNYENSNTSVTSSTDTTSSIVESNISESTSVSSENVSTDTNTTPANANISTDGTTTTIDYQ